MTPKQNKISKQGANQASIHPNKDASPSNTTWKERDSITPTKDKSPDDLEILD